MGLNDARVGAAIAVTDMARAIEFYEGKLGLRSDGDDPDGGRTYECAEGTNVHVFPSPHAAPRERLSRGSSWMTWRP